MIGPSGTVRVMVATKPVDFRKGAEGLATLVQRAAIIRIAGQRPGVQHELAAGSAGVGGDDRDLDADLWTTPALQEESTKGRSGLRQSIRLQIWGCCPEPSWISAHFCPQ